MISSRSRPPPRGPLRSSAGDAAATWSKVAQTAVTRSTRRRACAGVTSDRSALGLGGHLRERAAAFGRGERGHGPAGHLLDEIEVDGGREAGTEALTALTVHAVKL